MTTSWMPYGERGRYGSFITNVIHCSSPPSGMRGYWSESGGNPANHTDRDNSPEPGDSLYTLRGALGRSGSENWPDFFRSRSLSTASHAMRRAEERLKEDAGFCRQVAGY